MYKSLYKCVIALSFFCLAHASVNAQHCGAEAYIDFLETQHPGIRAHIEKSYLEATNQSKKASLYKLPPIDTVFVIPVVFHVVYRLTSQNIDDELIHDQMKVLNDAYSRTNADTTDTRYIFKSVAGSARIRFELATVDPAGNSTSGITRKQTTLATFNTTGNPSQNDLVKLNSTGGIDAWDTKNYLNIWVCNLNRSNGARALFGYAYPPVGADFWSSQYYRDDPYQGVVLHYEIVGTDNPSNLSNSLYTNEKTAVHEVGHFLGLRHTWGDPQFGQNGCLIDDYIDDTPPSIRANSGCNHATNTCTADNLPDQVENYMDYSGASCTNMFTRQQIGVMRNNLMKLRPDLANSEVLEVEKPKQPASLVYPNPFNSSLKIYLDDPSFEKVDVLLYDMLGRLVWSAAFTADEYVKEIDVRGVTNGMYYVEVISEKFGHILDTKMIKSH